MLTTLSVLVLVLVVQTSFSICYGQACNATSNTRCGDECHCVNRTTCGEAFCDGGCLGRWTDYDCQTECTNEQIQRATKCGEDCHCKNIPSCGADVCIGRCAAGWTGRTCQKECTDIIQKEPTKCGEDCHCENLDSCGDHSCDGICTAGWKGNTCQTSTAATGSCAEGKYGDRCQYNCNCPNRQSAVCDKTNGACTGQCNPGYTGQNCDQCIRGRYGLTCQNNCNCPNRQSAACDKTTGACTGRCNPGYTGQNCDQCIIGRYGSRCQYNCNCPNRQSAACDKTTGACTGQCNPGYTGPDCQPVTVHCPSGKYGPTCQNNCNCPNRQSAACDKTTGACTGQCNPGYTGQNCDQCIIGRYGPTCQYNCNCPNRQSTACDRTTGACTGQCNLGYTGPDCQPVTVHCPSGKYGPTCQNNCNCPNRESAACDKTTGACTGQCNPGYTGQKCDQCTIGRYGPTCQNNCDCPNRQSAACDKTTGACTGQCNPGYTGPDCQPVTVHCPSGKYGPTCQNNCNCPNRESAACDRTTGACSRQCNSGYTGQNCDGTTAAAEAGATEKTTVPSSMIGGIVGGVLGFVVLVVFVVVVVVLLRRRRRRDTRGNSESGRGSIFNRPITITDSLKGPKKRASRAGDSVVLSKVIDLNELVRIVGYCNSNPDALEDEFEALPGGVSKTSETAFLPQHAHKCRYKGMVPYDHSRVVLEPRDSDPYSDFINASYINGYYKKKKFVAAQGPTAFIMNDFWRMIWQLNTDVIIMLTKLKEGNKVKCDQYWPETESTIYGHITVELLATHQFEDFCVRTLTVRADGKVRTVKHFHFTQWGDHDAPEDTTGVISLFSRVQEAKDEDKGPIVVHCSAGVGRTGTFIAMDILLEQARAENQVDIPKCVTDIRAQRANMIQTQGQFTFLHRVLLDAWVGADSIVSTPEFAQKSASYFQPVPPSNVSRIQSEFEALRFLQTEPNPEAFSAAKTEKNRSKNRYRDHLPPDNSRTFLSTYIPGRTDYINAVYLPGYQNKFAYVSTQMPLPDTVVDFWRLVHELGSSTIIMLNTGQNEDGQYWPADDETLNLGPFEVHHQWTMSDAGNLLRQMNLIYVKGEEKKDQAVRQFCVNMWKPGSLVPASAERLINLQKTVQEWQKQNNNRPIIVHCENGVDRTVLLCTCFSLLEKLKAEHTISVLYTVNAMRKHRPGAVPNVEQYGFCYDVVRTFIESFDTYANFVS